MSAIPFLSIVMPVRNEARFIEGTIEQLLGQEYPEERYEVIVADGMSDDGTREIVQELIQKHTQIRLLDNSNRLSSAGRNVGFKSGRGDYFLVVDGHCYIPDNQLFLNVADCFAKSGADCLGRPQPLDPPCLTDFQQAVALARASWLGHGGDSLIYGDFEGFASPVSNGAAYARHVFDKVGYVDEAFDAAEDVEFNYRVEQAGFKCFTSPKLTVRYYPRESLKALFRQMIRYGRGRRRFTRKHPQALTFNQLIPACFVMGLFLLCGLLFFSIFGVSAMLLLVAAVPYAIYLLLLGIVGIKTIWQHGCACGLTVMAIIFAVHAGLGFGFIAEESRLLSDLESS